MRPQEEVRQTIEKLEKIVQELNEELRRSIDEGSSQSGAYWSTIAFYTRTIEVLNWVLDENDEFDCTARP